VRRGEPFHLPESGEWRRRTPIRAGAPSRFTPGRQSLLDLVRMNYARTIGSGEFSRFPGPGALLLRRLRLRRGCGEVAARPRSAENSRRFNCKPSTEVTRLVAPGGL
jgi:hypothetical protein